MNAMKGREVRDLQAQWARAVERAAGDERTRAEMDQDALNMAAGLRIQSGVQAGVYTGHCTPGG